jgi:cathepsin B
MKFFVFALCALCVVAAELPERLAIVEEVNAANAGWEAHVNPKFANKPLGHVKQFLGALPGGPTLPVKKDEIPNDIPTAFDPRVKWPNCPSLKTIRDQGPCGSCWAFGAVEAASDRLCIGTNGAKTTELSAEDLLSCCWLACGQGCEGGYPSSAWSFFNTVGVVSGNVYGDDSMCSPYFYPMCDHHMNGTYPPCPSAIQPTPKCNMTCANGANYEADKVKFQAPYAIDQLVSALQNELMTNGPIEVAFTVYADFEAYKSGVYKHTTGEALGGHAVKMMGWGTDAKGGDYWLIANSWNEDWGEAGYFRIRRGDNECGIESSGVAGLVQV